MRKLILKMSVSVDGFVGGPNGEIDWLLNSLDDGATAWLVDTLWNAGVHIMGSRTFHDMAAYWPTSTEPFAAPMNEIPKIVFTKKGLRKKPGEGQTTAALEDARRLTVTPIAPPKMNFWTDAKVIQGNLVKEIAQLKQQPGKDILAHGGAGFAQSLLQLGLVDEYRLLVHPVALGKGLPLFSAVTKPIQLKLLCTTPFCGGAVAHIYQPV